jgi:hypothetical protein
MELWLGIEDYLQEHAAQYRSRVMVFTGPIFSALDPDVHRRYHRRSACRLHLAEADRAGRPRHGLRLREL